LKQSSKGQIVIGAIVLLVVLALLVPALVVYIQNEGKWTVKEEQSTRAFQLAETAVERGFQEIITSSSVWARIQASDIPDGYHFDQTYTDSVQGSYEIRIQQGPGSQAATITGVAKDTSNKEVRAVKAVYSNSASNAAMFVAGGVTLQSNPGVEWGPVMSPTTIDTSQAHPRFYSAGSVTLDTNGATPPNSDNKQWWSYYANLPPAPQVDTAAYLSSATAQGAATHVLVAGSYSIKQDICQNSSSCTGVYYISGNATLKTPSAWVSQGAIIVMGNLTVNGSAGNGSMTATLPSNAWREYGNDWTTYRTTYDSGAPATFPGVNGSYTSPSACSPASGCSISNVLVHGFLYVAGTFDINGGGNSNIVGSMYVGNSSTLDGSHVKLYYDSATTVLTKNVSLGRASWQEIGGCSWTGSHPTCP
jgi:Tfp pilus assembly protein PilX